jgi:hypothetical protein
MSQGIVNSKPLYLGLPLMFALSSGCGMSPASAPPIVTAPQKDASANSMDIGGEPNRYPDATINGMDAEAMTPDQGNTFPDAQVPNPDAGFPPAPMDAGFPPAPMDAGFADANTMVPDTGANVADAMVDAGLSPDANIDAGFADAGMGMPDTGLMPPPVGDIFDAVSRADQIAAANCGYAARCDTFLFQYEQTDLNGCIAEQTLEYRVGFDIYEAAIAAGNLAFSEMDFDACITNLANADCELGLGPNDCSFLTGQRTQGQSCNYNAECSPDQYCSANGVAVCGMCSPRIALQQDCSNDPCVSGSVCAQTNTGASVCVPEYANENAACGDINSGFCRGRLQCRDPQALNAPVCVRPAGAGQACSSNSNTTPDCNFGDNQICLNAVCTSITWVGPGGNCTGASGCNIQGICDQASMVCLARPTNNQLCIQNTCAQGHYCDGTICRSQLQTGASCTDSNQCDSNLSCIGAFGNRDCGTPSWQACP